MRGLSICLLLAGLSQAAQVYLNPPPSLPPSLSPSSARLALSRHLGLEFFEPIGEDGQDFEGLFDEQPFVGKGSSNGLLLSLNEADAREVLPSSLKPSFTTFNPSASRFFSSLISTYIDRARHAYSIIYSSASHHTHSRSVPRLLDLFSVSSAETETFLTELAALSDFLESKDPYERFGAFELTGLQRIGTAYGRQSEQYKLAARTTHALLESALSQPNLHFALLTAPVTSTSTLDKRQPPQQSPLPPQSPSPVPQLPISACFSTADACSNATSACSGRGQCMQAIKTGRTCFVCACEQTKSSAGKIQTWVGESCERKDISGPFVLITGTVIVLILTIGGSVSLLYSIGGQELPSTLMGGVGGKRD